MRRPLAAAFATLVTSLLPAQDQAPPRLSSSRPNILFVFSDDHAAQAISAYGSLRNRTPNIDRIAAGGLLFRNVFCGNSICGPSRATVLTGLHTHAHGFMRNDNTFDGAQPTMPKMLQAAGYQTAIVGKWHLGSDPTGFDHWCVLPGQGHYYNPDFLTPKGRVRMDGHATDLTTELAIRWLERERDPAKPFLLMCQHKAPHRPWLPALQDLPLYRDQAIPEPATLFDDRGGRTAAARSQEMDIERHMHLHYDLLVPPTAAEQPTLSELDRNWDAGLRRMTREQRTAFDLAFAEENAAFRREQPTGKALVRWKYQRYAKNYLRCIAGVDRSVGMLLDWLARHPDVQQNTIVIYSSDQGFFVGEHGFYDKRWIDEESLRMPFVVQWPGRIAAGREAAQLAQNIDFAPTFLDLAGVPVPEWMHGVSLVPLLEGRAPADFRDAIYYHFYESQAVHMVPAHYGLRTDRHKLVHYYEPQWNSWELFDLAADPDERSNLADLPAHAELRAALTARLAALRKQYGDTTGDLGGGVFPVTAGLASLRQQDGGWQLRANALGGYALRPVTPAGARTTITATVLAVAGHPRRNGFVLAAANPPRTTILRAGIEFQAGRLVLLGPQGMQELAAQKIDWDGRSAIEVALTIDVAEKKVTASALGATISGVLPDGWPGLAFAGYGASNAETLCAELVVR
jgi:arylsulfatase A-like enzyme